MQFIEMQGLKISTPIIIDEHTASVIAMAQHTY